MLNLNRRVPMPNAAIADMQRIVRLAAEPRPAGDSVKAAIGRAARVLKIGHRRAYTFWHGYDAAVRADEADRLRAEELRLLARRRIAIETELNWIEARLNARGEQHGQMAGAQAGSHRPDPRPVFYERRKAPGDVGVIPDERQPALPI